MLKIQNWSKSFEQELVLDDINFEVPTGKVLTMIGASGTGKSTLLRTLNFLETPDEGIIQIDQQSYTVEKMSRQDILNIRRQTAMVFQNYGLFSRKTALENVMEALVMVKKYDKVLAKEEAQYYLEQVGIKEQMNRYPKQLSGGQKQRVGIARAMATKPKVMLLDEPTSALDPELVQGILDLIRQIAGKDMSILLATHEMSFAKEVSDQVIFLDQGKILDSGTPEYMFDHNTNERIQNFIAKIK